MEETTTQNIKEKLISIWRNVLVVDSSHEEDNFFSVGGHSIMAMELISEIETHLKIQLNMKDIVESPSLSELMALVTKKIQLENIIKLQGEVREFKDNYPLTLNQKQLWGLNALYPHSTTHNISTALRIKRPLDESILSKTLNYIINRQDSLRTNFKLISNRPVQIIVERPPLEISFIDLKEEELMSTLQHEMSHTFNLQNDELIRIRFFRLGPSEYVFFFLVHHIIWDGISNTMFFHEFNHCYSSFSQGLDPALPPLQMTLKEFALDEVIRFQSDEFKEEQKEWMTALEAPLPQLNLKYDFTPPAEASAELDTYYFEINQDLFDRLEAYAQNKHLSVYNVLMGVYNIALAKITGQTDLVIGTPVHGRNSRSIRKTFGYFINTLPIRTQLHSDKSFKENLSYIMESLKNAFYNQSVPLDVLIKLVNDQSDLKLSSLFKTLFIYLDVTKELDTFESLNFEQIKIDRLSGHTEIDFYLYKSRHKIEGVIEFKKQLFKHDSIENLAHTFNEILDQVLLNEEMLLNELGVKDQEQRVLTTKVKKSTEAHLESQDQTPLVFELAEIWKEVIGLKVIDTQENFFNLGGHSVQAVEIFSLINERFGIDLPISIIFEASSIQKLASAIEKEISLTKPKLNLKSIVTIKTAPPEKGKVFCFHGAGGNVLNYYHLGKFVGDKGFYGVQSLAVNSDSVRFSSIQEMAESYIAEIVQIQPSGPYILAGGSMGGMIALEVARQLQLNRQEVQEIIMFDTFGPHYDEARFGKLPNPLLSSLVAKIKNMGQKKQKEIQNKTLHYEQVQKENLLALAQYRPAPYSGNLTLFRGLRQEKGRYADPYLGWRQTILGRIQVIELEGSHDNFIETRNLGLSLQSVMTSL